MGMGMSKPKLITSLITNELQEMFNRNGIDPNEYVVYSGLLQVDSITEDFDLSKEDQIILAQWSVKIQNDLYDAEILMFKTLNKLFKDNPILESHRMNFPLMDSEDYMMKFRKDSIKSEKKVLSKLMK